MRRLPVPPLLVVFVLLLGGGVVAAFAAAGGSGTDPTPPAASADVADVVSIGRPISPYAAGKPATGQIEMRVTDPQTQAPVGVLFHPYSRIRDGRRIFYDCFEVGPERVLRDYPTDLGGSCRQTGRSGVTEPWSISTTVGGPAQLAGSVTDEVVRLTVAGPGGTFVVPRSAHGGFVVLYANDVTGRAVLTATLRDGSMIYHRTSLPPSFRPDGVAVAADPDGGADWYTGANLRRGGERAGETCLQVVQEPDLRADTRARRDMVALAPVCGDLRRAPLFARTVELAPTDRLGTFSPGPWSPRRTILAGAAGPQVRSLVVIAPGGRRALELAPAGRAFLAVFPPEVKPADLTLEATFPDGTVRRFPNPVAVNRTVSKNPAPRLRGRVALRLRPAGGRRIELSASLTGVPKRFEITFHGREVAMRRVPGSTSRYAGVYDGDRGARRPIVPGRTYGFSVLLCGEHCRVTGMRARLR